MPTTITIRCVVCTEPHTYAYKGGRKARFHPECKTARNTALRAVQRRVAPAPDSTDVGYPMTWKPFAVTVSAPDRAVVEEYRDLLDSRPGLHPNDRVHREYASAWLNEHRTPAQPDGVGYVPEGASAPVSDLYASAHGVGMDDQRYRDGDPNAPVPFRYIPESKRPAVELWCADNAFPIAGLAGMPAHGADPRYVFGRASLDRFESVVPPRIARHFCSRDALEPLSSFLYM